MIHIIFRTKLWLNFKSSWKESSNIYTTWKVFHTRVLMVLTHQTTWFISLGWNSLRQFFQEFLALLVIIKQVYLLFLKSKCSIFHFVYMDATFFHLIWKCAKNSRIYIHWCFQLFFQKPQNFGTPVSRLTQDQTLLKSEKHPKFRSKL